MAVDPDYQEIVVFDEHFTDGRYHGHVRSWAGEDGLSPAMQSVLRRAGLVGKNGKIKWSTKSSRS